MMFNIPGLQSRSAQGPPGAGRSCGLPNLLSGRRGQQLECGSPLSSPRGVCRDDFQVVRVLGRGGFGEVKLVRHVKDGQVYAMKTMDKAELHERKHVGDARAGERAQAERDICVEARQWRCPFILEMFAAFQTEEKLYYLFEYCPGGELLEHLCRCERQAFDELTARFYTAEACLALEHLHSHGVVHRDVRLENLLLAHDGHLKLADFGLAKRLPGDAASRSSVARPEGYGQVFYPPEFLQGCEYGKDLDCWQLGTAAFLMMTGTLPQLGADDPGDVPGCSPAAVSFCREALRPERARRLGFPSGAAMLRDHGFFQDLCWDRLAAKSIDPPPVGAAVAVGAKASVWSDAFARDSLAGRGVVDFMRLRDFTWRASNMLRSTLRLRSSRDSGPRRGFSTGSRSLARQTCDTVTEESE
ncbi:unnamed protein product [Prorocentrum cordatum]|uniref:non-specific serine/threonine protein kinase n=1 Tax=Prorocentrum cordatum TaxID=2364126 RepID=A0ABN9T2I2_9DINO|nr:unnamed protein product [Polarella glacialis]